jgi:hypothetical protein
MTVQGRPELTEAMGLDIIRRLVRDGTIKEEEPNTGFDESANEPDPEGTMPGRRLPYYDISAVGKAFWQIFGVKYEV